MSLSEEHPAIYVSYSYLSNPEARRLLTTLSSYEKRWIGARDPSCAVGGIEEGNSVLVNLHQHRYFYVGRDVFAFRTEDEVVSYVSPEGGDRIPFSIAYTPTMVYFLHAQQRVPVDEVLSTEKKGNVELTFEQLQAKDALQLYRALYRNTSDKTWNAVPIQIESRML